MAAAAKIWSTEILPHWEASRKLRKTRDLWWQGLPPSVRGQVWRLAIGNDLNVTRNLIVLFSAFLHHLYSNSLFLSQFQRNSLACVFSGQGRSWPSVRTESDRKQASRLSSWIYPGRSLIWVSSKRVAHTTRPWMICSALTFASGRT